MLSVAEINKKEAIYSQDRARLWAAVAHVTLSPAGKAECQERAAYWSARARQCMGVE